MIASQLSGRCDVISNRLWRHQQNGNRVSETLGRCVRIVTLSSFMDSLCRIKNKIMYVLWWRTVSALTRVLFWCLFPSLLLNSGNKYQNSLLVSAQKVRHSSTYTILYQLSNPVGAIRAYFCITSWLPSKSVNLYNRFPGSTKIITLRWKCHLGEILVTRSCQNENFLCNQWRKSRQNNIYFSVNYFSHNELALDDTGWIVLKKYLNKYICICTCTCISYSRFTSCLQTEIAQ